MKKNKLDAIKVKRLMGIFCWITNIQLNVKLLKGKHKFFDKYNVEEKVKILIPKKYYGGLGPSITYALLTILIDNKYDKSIISFLVLLDKFYGEYNKQYSIKGFLLNDDFWVDSTIEGKVGWHNWYLK